MAYSVGINYQIYRACLIFTVDFPMKVGNNEINYSFALHLKSYILLHEEDVIFELKFHFVR